MLNEIPQYNYIAQGIVVLEQPQREPLTVQEAEAHLRLEGCDNEQVYLNGLITVAREHIESYTGRSIMPRKLLYSLDKFPGNKIILPLPPVISVESIKYTDINGTQTTWASTEYIVNTKYTPAIIVPKTHYPCFTPQVTGAIEITYIAGYSDCDNMPEALRQAMKLIIGDLYEHREDSAYTKTYEVNTCARSLMNPYKVVQL